MDKLRNFWYYYKKHTLIALAVLLVAGYLTAQQLNTPEPDYHIGLISTTPRSDEQLTALTDGFAALGTDLNGDGQVLVQLHTYFVDLADDSPNAGVSNADKVAALDADLIGNVSGIFLTEDPQTLLAITGGIFADTPVPFGEKLYLCIRGDTLDAYRELAEAAAP